MMMRSIFQTGLQTSFLARVLVAGTFFSVGCSSTSDNGGTGAGGGGGGGTPKVTIPDNATYCGDTTRATACTAVDVCGVCVATPTKDAARSTSTKEYAGTGDVDTSCLEKGAPPRLLDATKSAKVKMKGLVKIFANGPDSSNVKVEVFKWLPTGKLGDKVGETTTTDYKPGDPPPPGAIVEKKLKGTSEIERILLPYEVDGIPSETLLIVRTSDAKPAAGWFPLYDYNIAARNELVKDGVYTFNVRALGNDDYASILKAAYNRLPEGGRGAIAGEVHDCGDVRISNTTVEVSPKSSLGLFYLSSDENNPLPDGSRKDTAATGLFAVGGLEPRIEGYRISAAAKVKGVLKAFGTFDVQIFPDSVSVYTFRGLPYYPAK